MIKSIFIFRRDLRLFDNTSLIKCSVESDYIYPIFIFTPEQIDFNKFKSNNAIQFMIESLKYLDQKLKSRNSKLHVFYGDNIDIIKKLIKDLDINRIYFNKDYTPYSRKRDKKIFDFCKKNNLKCISEEDYLLFPVKSITTDDEKVYQKYTPFMKKARKNKVVDINKKRIKNLKKKNLKYELKDYIKIKENENILLKGGRKNALKQLKKIKNQKNYGDQRNMLTYKTTLLSAYIKFGCISIREVYYKIKDELGVNSTLINQLIWRDFYFNIAYEFPRVFGKSLKPQYDKIKWNNNKNKFKKWCEGNTGFPIVDAGMREMNVTGYMHNRSRLITSSFLIKLLQIDWRWGEKYFAQTLIDYDPSVNNGNWQWSSSSGADSQPYFRIFNPWLQSKKFDKDAEYIKKWLPELKDVEPKHLHEWDKYFDQYDLKQLKYNKPIINYKLNRNKTIDLYKKYLK